MKIGIIILHYGEISVTKQCVKSIYSVEKTPFSIIVVNNDPTITVLKSMFPRHRDIIVINNKKNLGFAGGVNVGIRYALRQKIPYIVLLNNDTLLEKPIIKPLVQFLENNKTTMIAGPAIEFYKGKTKLYDLGGNLNRFFGRTNHTEVEKITNFSPRKTTYVTGACMFLKTEAIQKVGLLDEQFFLYYEDVDFCLRIQKKGFFSYVLPSVVITHALSKSIGKVSPLAMYHQTKSAVLFGKKYCKKTRVFNMLFIIAQCCLFVLKKGRKGLITFRGLRDGIIGSNC